MTGDELPTASALAQMKQRLLRRLFGRSGASVPSRKRLLRKLLIAAIVTILIVAMSISMMPLGTNDESLLRHWGQLLFRQDSVMRVDYDDYITLIKGIKVEEFKSIRQFVEKTQMDILVPTALPKDNSIKKVQLAYDYFNDCPSVTFVTGDPSSLAMSVYIGKEKRDSSYDKTEKIGSFTCGFLFSPEFCQCEFNYGGNAYMIVARSYKDVRYIVENLKGSLTK